MQNSILTAPSVEIKNLDSLFIEMTAKNCNLKCKHCYLDFSNSKKIKDFIALDKIKQAIAMLKGEKIKFIHLTGAEPMLHPDFNAILRYCLKIASVVIHTNGMSINDKKARFLRKVEEEDENNKEIIFKISIDHYEERKNDDLRGRGSFRKSIHAVQSLVKYDFNPVLSIVNYWNIEEKELISGFKTICKNIEFETDDTNFCILPYIEKDKYENYKISSNDNLSKLDCATSRTLTNSGIYNCPLLVGDHRGRCGSSFEDYSKKNYLETQMCSQCLQNKKQLFTLNWT